MGSKILIYDTYDLRKYDPWYFHTVVDIGSNVGTVSMLCRFIFPKSIIHAVEPAKETYDKLVAYTSFWGVQCHNIALGNGQKMYMKGSGVSGYTRFFVEEEFKNSPLSPLVVDSYTLSDMFELFKVDTSKPYLLKIDCEGSERFLLDDKKGVDLIREASHFIIELHIGKTESIKKQWNEYMNLFKDTHDIKIMSWYRSETRRHYIYTKIEELPLCGNCNVQLVRKS